jgi:hypothetical protein
MYRAMVLVAVFFVTCCVGSSGEPTWPQVKSTLIGKTYANVVACAGIPESQSDVGERTGAVLYRDTITGGFTCDATLIIKEGRVASITEREIPSTENSIHIPPDSVMWPNYSLCSRRFKNCAQ